MPEQVRVTFDPEVDFSSDAVGRSRYERFYSVRSNYAREHLVLEDVRKSPVEWGAFEGTFPCMKLRRLSRLNTFQRIFRSLPNFMYFVMLK